MRNLAVISRALLAAAAATAFMLALGGAALVTRRVNGRGA